MEQQLCAGGCLPDSVHGGGGGWLHDVLLHQQQGVQGGEGEAY